MSYTARDPYGAALGAVRRIADSGRFSPGEPIVVTDLTGEVGLSPTPVREALACLSGQGLVDRRPRRGYFFPALSGGEIIDLFELELAYLHAALTLYPRGLAPLRKAVVAIDPADGPAALFQAVIGSSGNAALSWAHRRLTDRLKAVLRLERTRNEADAVHVREMIKAIVDGRIPALLHLLEEHHERRCARIGGAWLPGS